MKDSGIEWIGMIPIDWKIVPHKYIMYKKKEICNIYNGEDIISLTVNGTIVRDIVNPIGKMPTTFDGYQRINAGNLLLCLFDIDVTPRCVGYIKKDGLTSPAYSQFILMNNNNSKYYDYLLRMIDNGKYFLHLSKNLRNSLTEENFGIIKSIVPPLDEQQKIVDFLDKKIEEIDLTISVTKESIEDYKRYKQAIITEVVTKGLKFDVEMKDSEIEWVRKIPKHWNVNMLSQIFYQHKEKNKDLSITNLLSLSYGKIKRKSINSNEGLLPESFENYNIVEKGDIVLRLTDLQNDHKSLRVGYVNEQGIITSAYITLRSRQKVETEYYYYYLYAFDIHKGFYGMGSGIRQGLNFDELKNFKIISPSIDEQKEIVEFLNAKSSEIEYMILEKEILIKNLEEYKKSLIYEYVTGKKEVE